MGKADFTYSLNIDANITNLTNKLKTVKSSLENALGDDPKAGKILDKLTAKLDSFKTKASTPIKSEAAFGKMDEDLSGIDRMLEHLLDIIDEAKKKTRD